MSYRARLLQFVDDLNYIAKDECLFPQRDGEFVITIKDGMCNVSGTDADVARVFLSYNDRHTSHPIFIKDVMDEDGFKRAYYEVMRGMLLYEDAVGKIKDGATGMPINILSGKTLLSEGLKKLKPQ